MDHICEARSSSSAADQGAPAARRPCASTARCGGRARGRRGGGGQRQRRGVDVGGRDRGPGESELDGLRAHDRRAEQLHGVGRLAPDPAGQQGGVPAARVQADGQEARQQLGVVGDDAQVGGQREVQARTDRAAADGGDRRRLQRADATNAP
nr:hypothetical protein [Baekduia soli]